MKLDRVGADIPIVRRHGSSFRRLTLIGSDGSQRHFIVQTSLTPNARSDERILQLFRVMNRMFDKHKESRRRHICIHTPIIIPVWSQVINLVMCCFAFSGDVLFCFFIFDGFTSRLNICDCFTKFIAVNIRYYGFARLCITLLKSFLGFVRLCTILG